MSGYLLNEEEALLKSTVKDFVDNEISPRAAAYDESGEFPYDNFKGLAELGLLGLTLDEEYGGSGGTFRQLAIAVEEVARACAATSTSYIAHLSLCAQFINMWGTDGQKWQFLPKLASGEHIGAFALTEPGSGSDAGAMRTTATRDNGGYLLNGSKTFITNAPEAAVFAVLATHDRSLRTRGIDALIVEGDSAGLSVNPLKGKMGMRASSIAEVVFEDCPVPSENRMGDEGEGFRETMHVLNSSRISIAAQCVGIAQAAYEAAVAHVKRREAFGQKLAELQAIQWMIADMATQIDAARLLVMRVATLRDEGMPIVKEASMAKLYASRVAVESADKSVQMHGGAGYLAPTDAERYYRDAKVTEIYEGTSEIQRLVIARSILRDGLL
ncbi:MAG: acyl-CoA dehydrogenase family protein [Chloroflexi bacterium]|nr:acyl-CoA dehydrogenase family protein [Chloroflexota bacterium]